ncbi:hypothetical protein KII93_02265 [Leuconostoc gelidum subsp. gasicomitatum]|uniref:hypothetical protein n=1 Tax=Leuconostoc gasicomitatum TaxID=115778 RepID=UPI0007DECA8E|nr:hypothetical protein [Leuconostoc gasicomitatum]MBZ5947302.1 hypothetical protein [Leuconostoc gasicomitatum]CUW19989.1 hypothetical protein PB1E_1158 [Leuconostoc gasicomitatum]
MNTLKIIAFYPVSNDQKKQMTGVFSFATLPAKYSFSFESGLINIEENTVYNLNYVLKNEYGQTLLNDNKETSFDFLDIKSKKPTVLNASVSLQTAEISIPLEQTYYSMTLKVSEKSNQIILAEATTFFATVKA